jgi:hypothetical protein
MNLARRMRLHCDSARGFALIVVLGLLAILTAFLFAAQGSVMTSTVQIKRSAVRMERHEARASILALARTGAEPAAMDLASGLRATPAVRNMNAGDELYPGIPGNSQRPGDRLVTNEWSGQGIAETENYLISAAQGRSGAIALGRN